MLSKIEHLWVEIHKYRVGYLFSNSMYFNCIDSTHSLNLKFYWTVYKKENPMVKTKLRYDFFLLWQYFLTRKDAYCKMFLFFGVKFTMASRSHHHIFVHEIFKVPKVQSDQ